MRGAAITVVVIVFVTMATLIGVILHDHNDKMLTIREAQQSMYDLAVTWTAAHYHADADTLFAGYATDTLLATVFFHPGKEGGACADSFRTLRWNGGSYPIDAMPAIEEDMSIE
jgi:hypothetical protein